LNILQLIIDAPPKSQVLYTPVCSAHFVAGWGWCCW
jgi:hypothetical protein